MIHHSHPESTVYIKLTPGVVDSVGLYKCIRTCIHHYSTIQSSFTALKILCAPPMHPSPHFQPLAPTYLFTVSIVLPFPEYHIVGIIPWSRILSLPVSFPQWVRPRDRGPLVSDRWVPVPINLPAALLPAPPRPASTSRKQGGASGCLFQNPTLLPCNPAFLNSFWMSHWERDSQKIEYLSFVNYSDMELSCILIYLYISTSKVLLSLKDWPIGTG